jgi:hypothetical protein
MRIHSLLVSISIVFAAQRASADDAKAAAEHIATAKKAFAEARYADAIAEFRAANALQPDPKLLYSIAQAQRMSGDCASAITTYEEVVKAKADAKADPKLVEFSEANIVRCKEQIAKEPVKEPIKEPIKEPVKEPVKEPLTGALPPSNPPQIERRDGEGSWTGDWLGHGLVAGGVGVAVVGTVLWIGGRNAAKAVNDATDHATFIEKRDAASSAKSKQAIGIAMGVAGAGLVVGGIVHYKMSGKREVAVGAAPTRGGAAIAARIRF